MLLNNINKNLLIKTLLGIVVMFGLSFISFLFPESRSWITLGVVLIFFVTTLYSLEWGIYLIILELLIGVQGYILAFEFGEFSLSLRITFFIIWLSIFTSRVLVTESREFLAYFRKNWWISLIPIFIILFGITKGIVSGLDSYAIFFDVNGYLFWLYALPFLYVGIPKQKLLAGLIAGVSWIIGESIVLLYTFGHHFDELNNILYNWLRDFRMIEVTEITSTLYRIFFQNQIFLILALGLVLVIVIKKFKNINLFLFTIILSGILISFSRSIWLGVVVMGVFLVVLAVTSKTNNILKPNWFQFVSYSFIGLLLSIGLWFGIAHFPLPLPTADLNNLVDSNRFGLDAAANARIQMLAPMWDGIKQKFLFGHGFGKTLTYFTTDPRIVASTAGASGEYNTFSFEWGYLDMMLKVGIIGLIVYLTFLFKFVTDMLRKAVLDQSIFIISLFLSLIGLLIINITTPYLNHPLGIGFIIITLLLSNLYGREKNQKIKN